MPLKPLKTLTSKTLVLDVKDIDTDQIIPARFLTVTTKEGLGENAFYDWRYNEDGSEKDSILNKPESKQCQILVAGRNFGCGSSREHAPWALTDYGFRAVISTEIADIFKGNSLKNSFLPIVIDEENHAKLIADPGAEVSIDVETQTVTMPDGTNVHFEIEPFAKLCLLQGVDQMGYLASKEKEIEEFEKGRAA